MTIGEALKTFRKTAQLTQTEMANGIVSESFYSKVERNLHQIDAETLINILVSHHMDVINFFDMLAHQPNEKNPLWDIDIQTSFAQNKKDLKKLDELEKSLRKIKDATKDSIQRSKFRIEIARAWVLHSNKKTSKTSKKRAKKILNNG